MITPPGFDGLLGGATYTSFVNGKTLPGAWNVELDVPVIAEDTSQGQGLLRVWGVSLAEIAQANDLNPDFTNLKFKNIDVYGGMAAGLPLANPGQIGRLVSGVIWQAFGNWVDTAMTLELVIMAGPVIQGQSGSGGQGTLRKPKNLVLNWQGGQPLGPALESALRTAFPGYTVSVSVSAKLVRPEGDSPVGVYSTLEQLAQDVRQVSRGIINQPNYQGVGIVVNGTTITASDAASTKAPILINFQDIIGQPTWLQGGAISLKTVMRGDLSVLRQINLPQSVIQNTAQSSSALVNQKLTFQGGFTIGSLRHVGDYRNPNPDAWCTVIEAFPNNLVATVQ